MTMQIEINYTAHPIESFSLYSEKNPFEAQFPDFNFLCQDLTHLTHWLLKLWREYLKLSEEAEGTCTLLCACS